MSVDIDAVYKSTLTSYNKAKTSIMVLKENRAAFEASAVSDAVPGYHADTMKFGSYEKDNFAVLFIDMRNSTVRAETIGPQKTFLSMHAYIPAMLEVVKYYGGDVVDIMGDGLMVFFGGRHSELTKAMAAQKAGQCGLDMLKVCNKVVNKIIVEDDIAYQIVCGVGIAYGDVIVTKIGINDIFDVKVFGDCVNKASHYSDISDKVKVSKSIKNLWPSAEGGKIRFVGSDDSGYIIEGAV